jgi:DnaK suppressor protein
MAKAKPKKSATKAKPVAKKAPAAKKASAAKKPAAKKPVPAKKVVAAKKAAPPAKKAVAAVPPKKATPGAKQPAVQVKGKTVNAPAMHEKAGGTSGLNQSPKLTAVTKPIKPIPIPSEVLKLKDKPSASDALDSTERREIHQSDIFSEEELRNFLGTLQKERAALLEKAKAAVDAGNIALDKDEMYDEVDLATATVDQNLTFRLLDRDRKLLNEIDHAINKIQTGEFGYCEGTGEPIPKRRLELRPWCRHSVKFKEQLEKLEKSGRGVVDEDAEMLD